MTAPRNCFANVSTAVVGAVKSWTTTSRTRIRLQTQEQADLSGLPSGTSLMDRWHCLLPSGKRAGADGSRTVSMSLSEGPLPKSECDFANAQPNSGEGSPTVDGMEARRTDKRTPEEAANWSQWYIYRNTARTNGFSRPVLFKALEIVKLQRSDHMMVDHIAVKMEIYIQINKSMWKQGTFMFMTLLFSRKQTNC
jgi:hypothetical protein